ncbi:MAG TPA: hypothetical protein VHX88_02660 [Solirubrobacteraceae bacterium]|nr:hypothetical protein [Solirubrobacteraceae bacterium]
MPVYPRWVAWCNLYIAASFTARLLPDRTVRLPGLFACWIPTVTYGLWPNPMAFTTRRAVLAEMRQYELAAA